MADARDAAVGLSSLYLFVWLYEIGNWVSLTAAGVHSAIMWSGFTPVGVMGVTPEGIWLPVAKLLQVGICVGTTLIAFMGASKRGLPITSFVLAGVTGMCIASLYWELLSITSFVPMILHEAIYVALSVAMTFGLLRMLPGVPLWERFTQEL